MNAKYTLSDLINRVKARLKDVDYSEADITQFLNDAYFEIVGDVEWRFLENLSEYDAFSGGVLPVPRDFQAVISLNAGSVPMKYLAPADYLEAGGHGLKNYSYTVVANDILFSIPDSTEDCSEIEIDDGHLMKLYYLAKPLPMVQPTDTTLIPYEYSEILVLGALARAEQLRDNFDYAQIYDNKKAELLTNMIHRYGPRQTGGANRMVMPVRIGMDC